MLLFSDLVFQHYGRTALHAAAEGGHPAVVEQLLQEKADVNAAAHGGRLHYRRQQKEGIEK